MPDAHQNPHLRGREWTPEEYAELERRRRNTKDYPTRADADWLNETRSRVRNGLPPVLSPDAKEGTIELSKNSNSRVPSAESVDGQVTSIFRTDVAHAPSASHPSMRQERLSALAAILDQVPTEDGAGSNDALIEWMLSVEKRISDLEKAINGDGR